MPAGLGLPDTEAEYPTHLEHDTDIQSVEKKIMAVLLGVDDFSGSGGCGTWDRSDGGGCGRWDRSGCWVHAGGGRGLGLAGNSRREEISGGQISINHMTILNTNSLSLYVFRLGWF